MEKTIHSKQNTKLRELLTHAREKAGMTQQELGTLLRKPQSFVAKYEGGERRIDVVEFLKITKLLRVDATKILKKIIPLD